MLTDKTRTTKVVCQPNADKGMGGGRGQEESAEGQYSLIREQADGGGIEAS